MQQVYLLLLGYFTCASSLSSAKPVAIVTGGTRGIGSGISEALADAGYDLLLTYNSNEDAANQFAVKFDKKCRVECVGGDISLRATRDKIFARLDTAFVGHRLAVMVHNAGQVVGITSDNCDGLSAGPQPLSFGDGSLLDEESGDVNLDTMHYYQRMYGEAFVDLCERSLVRMDNNNEQQGVGGSLVGISSPGVTAHYYGPDSWYSMPGAGKCLMEYSMRIYAVKAAERNINANVIVPGVVRTQAWNRMAKLRGLPDESTLIDGLVERIVPRKKAMTPRDLGNAVAFLCSDAGRWITGTVMPVDGGMHLKKGGG